jgi:hypothetical protein
MLHDSESLRIYQVKLNFEKFCEFKKVLLTYPSKGISPRGSRLVSKELSVLSFQIIFSLLGSFSFGMVTPLTLYILMVFLLVTLYVVSRIWVGFSTYVRSYYTSISSINS